MQGMDDSDNTKRDRSIQGKLKDQVVKKKKIWENVDTTEEE